MTRVTGKVDRGVVKVKIIGSDGRKVGGAMMTLKDYAKKSAGAANTKRTR